VLILKEERDDGEYEKLSVDKVKKGLEEAEI
jgi:hypothetical protein